MPSKVDIQYLNNKLKYLTDLKEQVKSIPSVDNKIKTSINDRIKYLLNKVSYLTKFKDGDDTDNYRFANIYNSKFYEELENVESESERLSRECYNLYNKKDEYVPDISNLAYGSKLPTILLQSPLDQKQSLTEEEERLREEEYSIEAEEARDVLNPDNLVAAALLARQQARARTLARIRARIRDIGARRIEEARARRIEEARARRDAAVRERLEAEEQIRQETERLAVMSDGVLESRREEIRRNLARLIE